MLRLCVIIAAVVHLGHSLSYRATINMAGIKGYVDFTPDTSDMNVTVKLTGTGVSNYTTFMIKSIPTMFGQVKSTQACDNLGNTITVLTGATNDATNTTVGLSEEAIFHRSVLITGNSNDPKLCAVILPINENLVTYRAVFMGPITGEVWVRKRQSLNGIFVYSNLAYATNPTNPTATTNLKMVSYASGSIGQTFSTRCNTLASPTDIMVAIPVGNSAAAAGRMSATFVQSISDVKTFWGLTNSSSPTIIACTHINLQNPRSAVTRFAWSNLRGTVTFTQDSPFDVTMTSVDLLGVQFLNATYHIHKFPVPQRLGASENKCSFNNVVGHYKPFGASSVGPANAAGTHDQYEVGDLSGKYGKLTSATFAMNYTDWNLPLFGVHSILGRSVVVHKSSSERYACANIVYNGAVVTAVATFKYPAYGYMYFQQAANDVNAPTVIFGALANTDHGVSVWHNFHVHEFTLGNNCASAGPHYNPTGVFTGGNYTKYCSVTDPYSCELGDVTGRAFEPLYLSSSIRIAASKFLMNDPYLHLSGVYNIIGRSIVIHQFGFGAARYACANITLLRPSKVETETNSWAGDTSDGSVTGKITMIQPNEFSATSVTANLAGLANTAGGYHIHILPLEAGSSGVGACSTSVISGHYSPFDLPAIIPNATVGTTDQYEVGDLSNKYGLLTSQASLSLPVTLDDNLPLSTDVSVAGRSVLIHKASGTPWKCNSLLEQPYDNTGHVIVAEVTFADAFTGYIRLRQVIYDDGTSTPTTIEVSVANNNGSLTNNHNWHVHIDPITTETSCKIAKGHYNPHGAPVSSANYAGAATCNRMQPLACELGDLSNKHAKYNIGGGRKLFVDVDLPLNTGNSVLGRSIVFHAAEAGSARIGCSNIQPINNGSNSMTIAFPSSVTYDYYRFTKAIADVFAISRHRVVVVRNTAVPVSGVGCSKVMVYIAGTLPSSPTLADVVAGLNVNLAPYAPTVACKSEIGLQVVGLSDLSGASINAVQLSFVLFVALTSCFMQFALF
nr:uncharacterized protein LOC100175270 [Ciona intestinalis]|eukprot:XP_002125536.1 uncharacterized protein LOC100175270 [Ciona intestinalis]